MGVEAIPRVSGISLVDFQRDYVEQGRPVVLEDASQDWPAISRWDRQYLMNHSADLEVQVRSVDPSQPPARSARRKEIKLRDFINTLPQSKQDDPYLAEVPLKNVFPNLIKDIGDVRYSPGQPADLQIMLSANSFAPMHYHAYSEAVSHQISGTRQFLLVPPSETAKLDPCPPTGALANFARYRITQEKIANSKEVLFEATLVPGNAIFIPLHWWHMVFAGKDISILLVDFFEFAHKSTKQTPVSERVDKLRQACQRAIEECNTALQSCSAPEDKAFYLQQLATYYRQTNNKTMEKTSLLDAIEYATTELDRAWMQDRIKELETK